MDSYLICLLVSFCWIPGFTPSVQIPVFRANHMLVLTGICTLPANPGIPILNCNDFHTGTRKSVPGFAHCLQIPVYLFLTLMIFILKTIYDTTYLRPLLWKLLLSFWRIPGLAPIHRQYLASRKKWISQTVTLIFPHNFEKSHSCKGQALSFLLYLCLNG